MNSFFNRENRKPSSLFNYTLRIAIPIGVVVLLAIWVIEHQTLQSTIENELRQHIEDVSQRETSKIQHTLEGLRDYAKSMAVNGLIRNGLIDLEDRDDYIPVFFRSLVAPVAREASVSLVDYTGRGVASSNNIMPPVSPEMVEKGAFLIDSHRLMVVEPILIAGSSEGAIVMVYPSDTFEELFGRPNFPYDLVIDGDNGLVVYSTNANLAVVGGLDSETTKEGWLQVRIPVDGSNISVVIGTSLDYAFESMATTELVQIISLMVLLVVIIGLVLLSVFIVSRPLKQFTADISKIRKIGDLDKHLDTKGPREIAEIASTFNRMADWLKSTTVSRNYMDNILASITEGIITIDHEGTITTFNAGASTIFGYDSNEVVGQNISSLLPLDERRDHDSYLAKSTLHAPRIIGQNRDLKGCRKDGSLFPLELVVTPLTEEGNIGFVGTLRDVTERKIIEERLEERTAELKRINKELEYIALNDSLTGLGNRNLFKSRITELIASSRRNQSPFALLMMDLNKFKAVNDTHGHEAGDEILREVGKRLKKIGRDADSFFRLGGDEFAALVITGVAKEGITTMARRIISAFNAPIEYNKLKLEIGISIGIVLYPEQSGDEDELLHLADLAMYEAKRGQLGFKISASAD